jgi:selenocysteine-specific elongation factor
VYVLATAGHVDHGKSTLVRALTGMEPDRWAEEQRRGMTIDLGFGWTTLASGRRLAFVDVPGHERFVANMLAGVGAAPGVLFVVAADGGWSAQSAEHLAAIDALGVRHGLLVITRSDLADPAPARAQAQDELAGSSLSGSAAVAVSAMTGSGMPELLAGLDGLLASMPAADAAADVRLWVDRAFTVKGRGTVVTGTLTGGTISVGDELSVLGGARVIVRGLQSQQVAQDSVHPVARVAVNIRGSATEQVGRGSALLSPGRFLLSDTIDVRLPVGASGSLMLHIGTAEVAVRVRPLGADTARLRLQRPLPLRIGDRAVLRDPGRRLVLGPVTVLDVAVPGLVRRGSAARRAGELASMSGIADPAAELRRRQIVAGSELAAMGISVTALRPVVGDWYADPSWWDAQSEKLVALAASGIGLDSARLALGIPDKAVLDRLIATSPGVLADAGTVRRAGAVITLAPEVVRAVEQVQQALTEQPFMAPESSRLAELGLDRRALSQVTAQGLLLHIGSGIYLLPGAIEQACEILAAIEQPFTLSQARQALGSTRRVAVPLLQLLDRQGRTVRESDTIRRLR